MNSFHNIKGVQIYNYCFQPLFNYVLQFDRKNVHELTAELIGPHSAVISLSIRDQLLGTYLLSQSGLYFIKY